MWPFRGTCFSLSSERSSPSTPANKFLRPRRGVPSGNKPKKRYCSEGGNSQQTDEVSMNGQVQTRPGLAFLLLVAGRTVQFSAVPGSKLRTLADKVVRFRPSISAAAFLFPPVFCSACSMMLRSIDATVRW